MAGPALTIKELYKAIGVDFARHISATEDSPREPAQSENIQQLMDKFVRSQANSAQTSMAGSTSVSATSGGLTGSTSGPPASSGRAPGSSTSPSNPGTPRYTNELWYQSLTSAADSNQRHSQAHKLPFAFHRMSHSSSTSSSPESSAPASQAPSNVSSPILSAISNAGAVGAGLGLGASGSSPVISSSSSFPTASSFSTAALAPHRLSAHLISLFQQGGQGVPVAKAASRIIVYLSHLMPYLSPRLVFYDWWDRLIEPALQGEIKLEKASLRVCRDLVVACMTKDQLTDGINLATGSMLTAGDEDGEVDNHLALTTMAIPQFVLRQYLFAAFRLNHQLTEMEDDESSLIPGSMSWLQSRISLSHQEATTPIQVQEQYKAYAKTKMALRRKKDLLVNNLEQVLMAYGGNVGRVKDFFSCLYTYFVGIKFRAEVLVLLSHYIRRQRVHLHQIVNTPLFDSLLLSLKYDTSPLIVSLGLTTLIMLMPRIPTALNDRLPDLFNILARVINWPKPDHHQRAFFVAHPSKDENPSESFNEFEDDSPGVTTTKEASSRRWSPKEQNRSADAEIEFEEISLLDQGIRWLRHGPVRSESLKEPGPDPTALFTFLYGLFPCNLLKFLHSPRRYISQSVTASEGSRSRITSPGCLPEETGVSPTSSTGAVPTSIAAAISPKGSMEGLASASYIDGDLLKSRVQPLLQRHSVHPNLLVSDAEKEISDMVRWQKLEPMEIVAMCVSLDIWSAAGPKGLGPNLMSIDDDLFSDESESSGDDGEDMAAATAGLGSSVARGEEGGGVVESHTALASAQTHHDSTTRPRASAETTSSEDLAVPEFSALPSRAQYAKGTPTTTFAGHTRNKSGSDPRVMGGQSQTHYPDPLGGLSRAAGTAVVSSRHRKSQLRSVRMSRILKNFLSLRGLDENDLASSFSHIQFFSTRPTGFHHTSGPGSVEGSRPISGTSDTVSHDVSAASLESTPISSASQSRRNSVHGGNPFLQTTQPPLPSSSSSSSTTTEFLLQDYRRMILQLERELMMAMNELNFELFLKQQHIQQISKVHRAHVMDASVEAERQNLYNTCRSLKAQLVETKLLLDKEKAEMSQRKSKQAHWDTDFKSKLQSFRDERKHLNAELDRLRLEIEDTRRQQQIQERLLTDERKNNFQLGNAMSSLQPKLKKLEQYEQQIEEMSQQLIVWENEQAKSSELQRQAEMMFTKWRSLEMLLAAEKEEARQLRNRISQQSQILDDMRIQMAIQDGCEPEIKSPEMEQRPQHHSHHHRRSLASVVEGLEEEEEEGVKSSGAKIHDHNEQGDLCKSSEMPWIALSRSNYNQAGVLDRRKSEAIQQFLWKEKERWDMELQQTHNRLTAEASKNRQLEDTIMDLRGQLEMALALNRRGAQSVRGVDRGGYDGGTSGYNTSVYDDETEQSEADPRGLIGPPSKAQDVPYRSYTNYRRGRGEGGDSDDDADTLGRYMIQHRKQQQLERQQKEEKARQLEEERDVGATTDPPRSSGKKGKSRENKEKKKSRPKWLQPPALLERANTDTAVYSQQQQPSSGSGGSSTTGTKAKRRSAIGSSAVAARATSGGFFTPSMHFRREGGTALPVLSVIAATPSEAVRGGGASDVSLQSSSTGGVGDDREPYRASSSSQQLRGRRQRIASHESSDVGAIDEEDEEGRMNDEGGEYDHDDGQRSSGRVSRSSSTQPSRSRGSSPGSSSTATTTRTKTPLTPEQEEQLREKRRERELERARERERLVNGGGNLMDPRKLYRNVRMF